MRPRLPVSRRRAFLWMYRSNTVPLMTADLRSFLDVLERNAPELLVRVDREVDPRWELSSVQKRLQADGDVPVLVFESVAGHRMPVVTNLFATKKHLALALDTTPERVVERFGDAQANRIPPREVASGPVKDVVS